MRIFAFEFFSGGGLAGRPLSSAIAHEGDIMLRALVEDLSDIPDLEVVATRDPRLPPLENCTTITPAPGDDPFTLYAAGLALADAAWPTAPESGGILERLASDTVAAGKTLLGCSPGAVQLTTSKRAAAELLRERGIATVPTFTVHHRFPPLPGPWITKPDDGAGCEDARLFPDWSSARECLMADPVRLVAQPWIEGESLSLSLLCDHGFARLLSCNRQQVTVVEDRLTLEGLLVNALPDLDGGYAALGSRIAAAIPGLWGYVGVDLVLTRDGPVVLEINPRLTTSYCGLRSALGINVAAMVLDLICGARRAPPPLPVVARQVEVRLESCVAP